MWISVTDIYLSIWNIGSFFALVKTTVLKFHLNVDYTAMYGVVLAYEQFFSLSE